MCGMRCVAGAGFEEPVSSVAGAGFKESAEGKHALSSLQACTSLARPKISSCWSEYLVLVCLTVWHICFDTSYASGERYHLLPRTHLARWSQNFEDARAWDLAPFLKFRLVGRNVWF